MAVVLVHGLSGSSRWWRPVVPLLGERDVRVVDVPRSGRAADWLAAQLDGPSDLVGHSLGGLACARVAAERPELVRRLVLVSAVGARDKLSRGTAAAGLARTLASAPVGVTRTVAADALRAGPLALARGVLAALGDTYAGEIRAPTLLVWGERDALVPVDLAQEWLRRVPHARLEVIPRAGHVPMLEAPSAFAEVVVRFLDEPREEARVRPVDGVRAGDDDEAAAR